MRLRVLGTAAGGGVPQWNCACAGCAGARRDPARRRRHASLAVRTGPGRWFIVNATPDIGDQIESADELWPQPPRRTPVAGIVLTDAELDHTLGIARLREADELSLWATRPVRAALVERLRLADVLAPYADLHWCQVRLGAAVDLGAPGEQDGTVQIEGIPISAKRPRYVARWPADPGWVVALRITDRATGGVVVYAPALGVWSDALAAAVAGATCVIVDGTFWDDEEPRAHGLSARTATQMGHLPITGPDGTAARLAGLPGRRIYTHLNNTNPLVDPAAPQHKVLADQGLEVAADGMVLDL
jgi:pyrroloquinoline quinone biosynthesis protein B